MPVQRFVELIEYDEKTGAHREFCAYSFHLQLSNRLAAEPRLLEDASLRRLVCRLVREKALQYRDAVVEDLFRLLEALHMFEVDELPELQADLRHEIGLIHMRLRGRLQLSAGLWEQKDQLLADARQRLDREHPMRGERRREVDLLDLEGLLEFAAIERLTGGDRQH